MLPRQEHPCQRCTRDVASLYLSHPPINPRGEGWRATLGKLSALPTGSIPTHASIVHACGLYREMAETVLPARNWTRCVCKLIAVCSIFMFCVSPCQEHGQDCHQIQRIRLTIRLSSAQPEKLMLPTNTARKTNAAHRCSQDNTFCPQTQPEPLMLPTNTARTIIAGHKHSFRAQRRAANLVSGVQMAVPAVLEELPRDFHEVYTLSLCAERVLVAAAIDGFVSRNQCSGGQHELFTSYVLYT